MVVKSMPQLTFPITAVELCVDVLVNRNCAALRSLHTSGLPLPTAIQAKGLIDTGTNVSAIAPTILQQLTIPVHSRTTTQSIGSTIPVRLFKVMLFILDAGQPHLPWLVQPDLLVMELPTALSVEALVGMDVLSNCKMLLDGPARRFTLDF